MIHATKKLIFVVSLLIFFLATFQQAADGAPAFEPVTYVSFQGDQYSLFAVKGRNIALLVDHTDYDINILATFISKLDLAYDFYKTTTGREPAPLITYDGLLSIAVVDTSYGLGCGYLGATGIEILTPYFRLTYALLRDTGLYESALFYELGRNFWFYGSQIGQFTTPFVTGFAVANRYLAMEYAGVEGITFEGTNADFALLKDRILNGMSYLYFKDAALDWSNTLATDTPPPNPYGLDCVCLAASLLYRIHADFGSETYAAFFQALGLQPASSSLYDDVDHFTNAYQTATGSAHGCPLLKTGFQVYANNGASSFEIGVPNYLGAYYGYEGATTMTCLNDLCDIFAGPDDNSISLTASWEGIDRTVSCGDGVDTVEVRLHPSLNGRLRFISCEQISYALLPISPTPALLLLMQ